MVDVQVGRPSLHPLGQSVRCQSPKKEKAEKKSEAGTRSVREFYKPVRFLNEDIFMLEVEKERRLEMVAKLKLQFRARRLQIMLVDWSREVVDNLVKEVCNEGRKRVTWRVESILTGLVELSTANDDKTQEFPELQMAKMCV